MDEYTVETGRAVRKILRAGTICDLAESCRDRLYGHMDSRDEDCRIDHSRPCKRHDRGGCCPNIVSLDVLRGHVNNVAVL